MIHTVTEAMYVVGRPCPYCGREFAVDDLIVEDDHPLRHVGCGPVDGWDGSLTDDEIANRRTRFGAKIERDPEFDLPAEDGMPAVKVWRIVDEDDDLPLPGEKGDELFVPDTDGQIIPHDEARRLLAQDPNDDDREPT